MVKFNWRQKDNYVFLQNKDIEIHFEVPNNFKLNDTHPTLLRLVEYLVFGPFEKEVFKRSDILKWKKRVFKKTGDIALSWSTGKDSTAAMLVLPENTLLFYHQRDEYLGGSLDQDNAFRFINHIKGKKRLFVSKSNQEKVRMLHGKERGFSTPFSCVAGLVLLADHFKLNYIATGTMLDSTFIEKGCKYRDLKEFWSRWGLIFGRAGLKLVLPVGNISEVLTSKIVSMSEYDEYSFSCIRGNNGKACGKCYKCFRKNLLDGKEVIYSSNADRALYHSDHLHQGDALIWAYQRSNLKIPRLEEYRNLDLSFLERYYPLGNHLIPEKYRSFVLEKFKEYDIKPMNKEDIKKLKKIDIK